MALSQVKDYQPPFALTPKPKAESDLKVQNVLDLHKESQPKFTQRIVLLRRNDANRMGLEAEKD